MDNNTIDKHIDDITILLDHNWCLYNIESSCTNDAPPTRFNDNKKHTWFSYDKDKVLIKQITFNYVIVYPYHSFAGTNFHRIFYLGNKMVSYSDFVYPTFDECKENVIKQYNNEIHGYEYAIKLRKDIIDKVNLLDENNSTT